MYAELRVYTVNRGKFDEYVRWFNDKLTPVAKDAGHTILGPWANEDKTELIWIRVYDSADDAKTKNERFMSSPAWKAIAPEAGQFVAKADVTIMNAVSPG
jgi:hypothetical protein